MFWLPSWHELQHVQCSTVSSCQRDIFVCLCYVQIVQFSYHIAIWKSQTLNWSLIVRMQLDLFLWIKTIGLFGNVCVWDTYWHTHTYSHTHKHTHTHTHRHTLLWLLLAALYISMIHPLHILWTDSSPVTDGRLSDMSRDTHIHTCAGISGRLSDVSRDTHTHTRVQGYLEDYQMCLETHTHTHTHTHTNVCRDIWKTIRCV